MNDAVSSCLVQVFRSPRQEGMYLIVDRARGLEPVPAALLERFGTPEPSFVFKLTSTRAMAHADPEVVLAALAAQGFFLQLPPEDDDGERNR